MHTMKIMSPREGDEIVTWHPADEKSVEKARKKFEKAKKKGMIAYEVVEEIVVHKGEQITEFDPNLRQIVLAPALAGG